MNFPRLRILVADVAAMDARIRAILPGDELTFAHATPEVERLLEAKSYELLVVCHRFDAHGFDLLRNIASRCAGALPVVCIRPSHALDPAPSADGYKETVLGLGARLLADVRAGSPVEYDRVRRLFYGCIDKRTRMLKSNAYTRVLELASQTLGSRERLAAFLGVGARELTLWCSGAELPPFTAYCSALDIIAAGPFADAHRRPAPRPADRS